MKWFGKIPIGSDGFPVEFIVGRPITNFFRLLLLTDLKRTARGGWMSLGPARCVRVGDITLGDCNCFFQPYTGSDRDTVRLGR